MEVLQGRLISAKRAAVALVMACVAVAGSAAPLATAQERMRLPPLPQELLEPCRAFYVFGVRGAGQQMTGSFRMGGTLQPYAQRISDGLSGEGTVAFYSLPYRAPRPTPSLNDYQLAVEEGRVRLNDDLLRLESDCPESRVGLLAFSEGAHVVQRTLPDLDLAQSGLQKIRAMLLMGNPVSAGDTDYDLYASSTACNVRNLTFCFALTEEGPSIPEEVSRVGGGVLGRTIVPAELRGRTTDLCFQTDGVCENQECFGEPRPPCGPRDEPSVADPGPLVDFVRPFAGRGHFVYDTCCFGVSAVEQLGSEFVERMTSG